jgi:hypothetical protein
MRSSPWRSASFLANKCEPGPGGTRLVGNHSSRVPSSGTARAWLAWFLGRRLGRSSPCSPLDPAVTQPCETTLGSSGPSWRGPLGIRTRGIGCNVPYDSDGCGLRLDPRLPAGRVLQSASYGNRRFGEPRTLPELNARRPSRGDPSMAARRVTTRQGGREWSPNFASWNHVGEWLRRVDSLRNAA